MSWTLIDAGVASWVTQTSQTASWSTTSVYVPPWTQLSSVVSDGVDFRAEMRDDYPMPMQEDRAVTMVELYPEGIP
jgi:hypothetical protein